MASRPGPLANDHPCHNHAVSGLADFASVQCFEHCRQSCLDSPGWDGLPAASPREDDNSSGDRSRVSNSHCKTENGVWKGMVREAQGPVDTHSRWQLAQVFLS